MHVIYNFWFMRFRNIWGIELLIYWGIEVLSSTSIEVLRYWGIEVLKYWGIEVFHVRIVSITLTSPNFVLTFETFMFDCPDWEKIFTLFVSGFLARVINSPPRVWIWKKKYVSINFSHIQVVRDFQLQNGVKDFFEVDFEYYPPTISKNIFEFLVVKDQK